MSERCPHVRSRLQDTACVLSRHLCNQDKGNDPHGCIRYQRHRAEQAQAELEAAEAASWPRSIRVAVRLLYARMSDADIELFQGLAASDALQFHHTLGRQVRNQFGMWRGNACLLQDLGVAGQPLHEAADGGSQIIIRHLIGYVHDLHGPKPSPEANAHSVESTHWLIAYMQNDKRTGFVNSAHMAMVMSARAEQAEAKLEALPALADGRTLIEEAIPMLKGFMAQTGADGLPYRAACHNLYERMVAFRDKVASEQAEGQSGC